MQPLDPLRFLLIGLAGWIHEQQRDVIDYLQKENRVFRDQLGNKRLRLEANTQWVKNKPSPSS